MPYSQSSSTLFWLKYIHHTCRVLTLSYLSNFLLKTLHLIRRLRAGDIMDVINDYFDIQKLSVIQYQ